MTGDRLIEWLVVLGLGGVLVETVRSLFMRKKMGADYATAISGAAISLLEPLEHRIHQLEQELDQTRMQLTRVKLDLVDAMEEAEHWKKEAQKERTRFHEERDRDE